MCYIFQRKLQLKTPETRHSGFTSVKSDITVMSTNVPRSYFFWLRIRNIFDRQTMLCWSKQNEWGKFPCVYFCTPCIFQLQILEAEGMLVPDELSCILQLVSEHLREPCPITSLNSTQGPAHHEGLVHPAGNGIKTSGRRQAQQVNTTRPERSSTLLWVEALTVEPSSGLQRETGLGKRMLPQPLPSCLLPARCWRGRGDDGEEGGWERQRYGHLTADDLLSCLYERPLRQHTLFFSVRWTESRKGENPCSSHRLRLWVPSMHQVSDSALPLSSG